MSRGMVGGGGVSRVRRPGGEGLTRRRQSIVGVRCQIKIYYGSYHHRELLLLGGGE